MTSAEGSGSAGNAKVETGRNDRPQAEKVLEYLRTVAREAEQAIPVIEKMIAGLKESLAAKKAEAGKLRADFEEALKGDK